MPRGTLIQNTSDIPPEEWGPGYRLWQSIRFLLAQRGPEEATPLIRIGSHLIIFLAAVTVLWFSQLQLPQWDVAEARVPQSSTQPVTAPVQLSVSSNVAATNTLIRAAVPITLVPARPRTSIITHTVQAGDTLYGIAGQYGISADTLIWANHMELNPDMLRLGQKLMVLPVNGVYHTVEKGDTIASIAKKYKAKPNDIVNFAGNDLDPRKPTLKVGQKLIVPGGSKPPVVRRVRIYTGPIPTNAKRGTGHFVWPTSGVITQGFKPHHQAIDIAAPIGTPIKASDSGYVVWAGWNNQGYGNLVIIDHGNGFRTLYAHLSRYFVAVGDSVAQGTVIGLMGATGHATGPHLHFEIRKNGIHRNPFGYLP